jgi:hypothetical protein
MSEPTAFRGLRQRIARARSLPKDLKGRILDRTLGARPSRRVRS